MSLPQADHWLSNGVLRWIGGVRTYGQRLTFYLGVLNTATLMLVLYETSPLVSDAFPSVAAWLAFVALGVVPAVIAVDYVLMHPSQIIYNQHQNGHENRSPNYRETMENQREIHRLHRRLDEAGVPQMATDGGGGDGTPDEGHSRPDGVDRTRLQLGNLPAGAESEDNNTEVNHS